MLLAGCLGPQPEPGATRQAIIHGDDSGPEQDATVLLLYDAGGRYVQCTGTLVSPRLVITARHCVAETDTFSRCGPDGTSEVGGRVHADRDPARMLVYTGHALPVDRPAAARGARILSPGTELYCNSDLAALVLDRPVTRVKPARLQIDVSPEPGDTLVAVGWGTTERELFPSVRKQRPDIVVDALGPSGDPRLGDAELSVGESFCFGDSGGPAYSASGALIGVASRGTDGEGDDPKNPASPCMNNRNVYTRLAPWRSFLLGAFDETGELPDLEPPPASAQLRQGAPSPSGGCSVAAAPAAAPWPLLLLFALLLRRRLRA